MKAVKLKLGTPHGQWANVLCIPESGPLMKMFRHTFLKKL